MEFFKKVTGADSGKAKDNSEHSLEEFVDDMANVVADAEMAARDAARVLFEKSERYNDKGYFFSVVFLFVAIMALMYKIKASVLAYAEKSPPEAGSPHPKELFEVLDNGFRRGGKDKDDYGLKTAIEDMAEWLNRFG